MRIKKNNYYIYEELQRVAAQSPGDILEIGSFKGLSVIYLYAGNQGRNQIYCIDLWDAEPARGKKENQRTGRRAKPSIYQSFLNNVDCIKANVIPIKANSQDVEWKTPLGMLFIDGDHSFEGCRADYERFAHYVIPGGFLAIHDYNPRKYPGVVNVINDIVKPSGLWDVHNQVGTLMVFKRRTK